MKLEFQFEPPRPLDYERYLTPDLLDAEEPSFAGLTRFRERLQEEGDRHRVKLTRVAAAKSKTEAPKTSEHTGDQSQLEWNAFFDAQHQDSLPLDSLNDFQNFQVESLRTSEKQQVSEVAGSHHQQMEIEQPREEGQQ